MLIYLRRGDRLRVRLSRREDVLYDQAVGYGQSNVCARLVRLTVVDQLSRVFETYSLGIDGVPDAHQRGPCEHLVRGEEASEVGRARREG